MVFRENVLYIYTDGSSLQSPRRGGIGIRFINVDANGEEQVQDVQSPGYKGATNNQMELKACVMAIEEAMRLQLTKGVTRIIIRTDSHPPSAPAGSKARIASILFARHPGFGVHYTFELPSDCKTLLAIEFG